MFFFLYAVVFFFCVCAVCVVKPTERIFNIFVSVLLRVSNYFMFRFSFAEAIQAIAHTYKGKKTEH